MNTVAALRRFVYKNIFLIYINITTMCFCLCRLNQAVFLGQAKPWPNFPGIMQNCIGISMTLFPGLQVARKYPKIGLFSPTRQSIFSGDHGLLVVFLFCFFINFCFFVNLFFLYPVSCAALTQPCGFISSIFYYQLATKIFFMHFNQTKYKRVLLPRKHNTVLKLVYKYKQILVSKI